jgi:hypothetical protein
MAQGRTWRKQSIIGQSSRQSKGTFGARVAAAQKSRDAWRISTSRWREDGPPAAFSPRAGRSVRPSRLAEAREIGEFP